MAEPKELSDEELWAEISTAEGEAAKPLPAADPHAFAEKPESGNDEPSEDAAAEVAAAEKTEAPDIWASAPPDLKAAHDAQVTALQSATTEHARRSIEGRIAAYTRRLQERTEAAAQQPKPQEEEATDPLAELASEYPEIATPLQQKLAPLAEKISRFDALEQSRQAAADAQMDAELKANEGLLEQQHPGWNKYLKQYGAAFGEWIVDQPLYYRQAFVTNKEAIIDPYSAIDTIAAFKSFVAQNTQPAAQAAPNGRPAAAPQNGLNTRRAAQLAGTATPSSVGSRPTVSGIPQDGNEEQIWKAFADIDPDERKYRSA
jgi:hypothetical protein